MSSPTRFEEVATVLLGREQPISAGAILVGNQKSNPFHGTNIPVNRPACQLALNVGRVVVDATLLTLTA